MSYPDHHLTTPGWPLGGPAARWSSNALPEAQWHALVYAFRFWDKANTPDQLPGCWVKGNISTVRYCSELDASVVMLPENLALPFDNYIGRCPITSESEHARLTKSYQTKQIEIVQVIGVSHSGGGRRQAMLATTSLLVVTALLAFVAATL